MSGRLLRNPLFEYAIAVIAMVTIVLVLLTATSTTANVTIATVFMNNRPHYDLIPPR